MGRGKARPGSGHGYFDCFYNQLILYDWIISDGTENCNPFLNALCGRSLLPILLCLFLSFLRGQAKLLCHRLDD